MLGLGIQLEFLHQPIHLPFPIKMVCMHCNEPKTGLRAGLFYVCNLASPLIYCLGQFFLTFLCHNFLTLKHEN